VGIITSAIGWGCRARKFRVLDREIREKLNFRRSGGDDDFIVLSPNSRRVATPLGESPPDSPPATDTQAELQAPFIDQIDQAVIDDPDPQFAECRSLVAKKLSNANFFWTNLIFTACAVAVFYGLRKHDVL